MEKSKQGIYATSYCIKGQIREYKARLNKTNYIEGLGVRNIKEPKDKVLLNFNKIENTIYFNPISKIDCALVPKHTLSSRTI